MRGTLIRIVCLLGLGMAVAGCQSPGAVGAVGPAPDAFDLLAAGSGSTPPPSSPLPTGPATTSPLGFVGFCMRMPTQCAMPASKTAMVTETPKLWLTLRNVNETVNTEIAPEDDEIHYGRPDYWTIPTDGIGDCEDYALTKRKALIEAGLPEDALRIAVVRTWDGERHAVLTVSTNKGDYVLDNLRGEILPWAQANYVWVERQSASNPWNWVALQGDDTGHRLVASKDPVKPSVGTSSSPPATDKRAETLALLNPTPALQIGAPLAQPIARKAD